MTKNNNQYNNRIVWPGGTMLFPLPAVIVSCGTLTPYDCNLITIAWTGIISTNPPRCYISVRPLRQSYSLIDTYREFVINLTTKKMVNAVDWIGVKSKNQVKDKFVAMKLTPIPAVTVKSPLLLESPLNLECRVFEKIESGSHHVFLADILHVHADPAFYDSPTGRFDLHKAQPLCFCHGHYYSLGEHLGYFGFSIRKKK